MQRAPSSRCAANASRVMPFGLENGMPQHPNILELLGDASHSRRFIRWRDVVRHALNSIGGEGGFLEITKRIEELVPSVWLHRYWEYRVLRIIRKDSEIEKVGRDRWRLRPPAQETKASST